MRVRTRTLRPTGRKSNRVSEAAQSCFADAIVFLLREVPEYRHARAGSTVLRNSLTNRYASPLRQPISKMAASRLCALPPAKEPRRFPWKAVWESPRHKAISDERVIIRHDLEQRDVGGERTFEPRLKRIPRVQRWHGPFRMAEKDGT